MKWKFYEKFDAIFHYVRDALDTKYILALSKLFGRTGEESLWKLIQQTKLIPERAFEIRLERMRDGLRDRFKKRRDEFWRDDRNYEKRIKEIRSKLKPLRNSQRAHNFPLTESNGNTTWNETKDWIEFAEIVYAHAMDAICRPRTAIDYPVLRDLETEIKDFISLLNDEGNIKTPTTSSSLS